MIHVSGVTHATSFQIGIHFIVPTGLDDGRVEKRFFWMTKIVGGRSPLKLWIFRENWIFPRKAKIPNLNSGFAEVACVCSFEGCLVMCRQVLLYPESSAPDDAVDC